MNFEKFKKIDKFYKAFVNSERFNEKLKNKLLRINDEKEYKVFIQDELLPTAKAMGYDLSMDEILSYEHQKVQQLSDEELESVTGGAGSGKNLAITFVSVLALSGGAYALQSINSAHATQPGFTVSETVSEDKRDKRLDKTENEAGEEKTDKQEVGEAKTSNLEKIKDDTVKEESTQTPPDQDKEISKLPNAWTDEQMNQDIENALHKLCDHNKEAKQKIDDFMEQIKNTYDHTSTENKEKEKPEPMNIDRMVSDLHAIFGTIFEQDYLNKLMFKESIDTWPDPQKTNKLTKYYNRMFAEVYKRSITPQDILNKLNEASDLLIPWDEKVYDNIISQLEKLYEQANKTLNENLKSNFKKTYETAYKTGKGAKASEINNAVYNLHQIFQEIFGKNSDEYTILKFKNAKSKTKSFLSAVVDKKDVGIYCEEFNKDNGYYITPSEILAKINKAIKMKELSMKKTEVKDEDINKAYQTLETMVSKCVVDQTKKGTANEKIETFKKSFSNFVAESKKGPVGSDIIDGVVYNLHQVYQQFFDEANHNASLYNFAKFKSENRRWRGKKYYNAFFKQEFCRNILPEDIISSIEKLNDEFYSTKDKHYIKDGTTKDFNTLIKTHIIGGENATDEQAETLRKNIQLACEYSNNAYGAHDRSYGDKLKNERFNEPKKKCYTKLSDNFEIFGGDTYKGENQTHSGIVDFKDGCLIIAFHGSDNMSDYVTDANAAKKEFDPLERHTAHKGFVERYELIKDGMYDAIKKVCAKEGVKDVKKVIVTGHSLGGALATLAAIDINNELNKKSDKLPKLEVNEAQLITFCSPTVLSTNSVNHVQEHKLLPLSGENVAVRIWRQGDIVPKLPIETQRDTPVGKLDYKHIGKSCCISKVPPEHEQSWEITKAFAFLPWHSIGGVLDDIKDMMTTTPDDRQQDRQQAAQESLIIFKDTAKLPPIQDDEKVELDEFKTMEKIRNLVQNEQTKSIDIDLDKFIIEDYAANHDDKK